MYIEIGGFDLILSKATSPRPQTNVSKIDYISASDIPETYWNFIKQIERWNLQASTAADRGGSLKNTNNLSEVPYFPLAILQEFSKTAINVDTLLLPSSIHGASYIDWVEEDRTHIKYIK